MRLRTRLALSFLLVILAGAITTFAFVRVTTEREFRSFVFTGDSDKARVYSGILGAYFIRHGNWDGVQEFLTSIPGAGNYLLDAQESYHGDSSDASPDHLDTVNTLLSDRIAVADLEGVVVADTSGRLLGTAHPQRHLEHGIPILANGTRAGTVLVGSMVDSSLTGYNERFLRSIAFSLLWATLFSSGIALLLALVLTGRIARPLAALSTVVERVASGDLGAQALVRGHDEISELSASVNRMTSELKRLGEARRQMIADSAHELRTPVTLIRGTVEAMIDGIYPLDVQTLRGVHEETLRLSRLIDMLRELEMIESGRLKLERVDVASVAKSAVASFESLAREKVITLSLSCAGGPPPEIRADYVRVGEIFYNLISNAVKYSPEGGKVSVSVSAQEGGVSLFVEDSGPGIPVGERERVFERFYRLDKSRSSGEGGRGLGLAIVGEIVKAHGGKISLEDSALGGASFAVFLPAMPPLAYTSASVISASPPFGPLTTAFLFQRPPK